MTGQPISLAALNGMSDDDFVGALSGIFEHSPWIPAACLAGRPFASVETLHQRMVEIVQAAPGDAKSRLLRAHPELAAKTTGATTLTAESTAEQASLGLDRLADDESERFESLNRRYRDSFGFPFIIAVRGQRDRQAILLAIETRLGNRQAEEIDIAIGEVAKIAWFRLSDLVRVGRLTTHVLDVRLGQPARGLAFTLFRIVGTDRVTLNEGRTNDDGRAANPLLEGEAMVAGLYELGFAVGAYQAHFLEGDAAGFYDIIPIRFRIADVHVHYHVPLLLSPFGYSTYRGS